MAEPLPLTFDQLVELEPRLGELLAEAKDYRRKVGADGCAGLAWPRLRARLCRVVGWERADRHPILSRSPAFDAACNAVFEALPPCHAECACRRACRQGSGRP